MTEIKSPNQTTRTLWNLLNNVFSWFYHNNSISNIPPPLDALLVNVNDNTSDELMRGWEWIVSTAEGFLQKQNEEQMAKIRKELSTLRKISNNVSLRPKIIQAIQTFFSSLNQTITSILINSRLEASNCNSILRDIINSVQKSWLTTIIQLIHRSFVQQHLTQLFKSVMNDKKKFIDLQLNQDQLTLSTHLKQCWTEEKYKKNICGETIAFASRSSQPVQEHGLTYQIFGDILWAIYLCLAREITVIINRSLSMEENQIILNMVLELKQPIVDLWLKTTSITGTIIEREGKLPSKWQSEDHLRQEYLNILKETGVDAKFTDGPSDELWRSHYFKYQRTISLPHWGGKDLALARSLNDELLKKINKRVQQSDSTLSASCPEMSTLSHLIDQTEFVQRSISLKDHLDFSKIKAKLTRDVSHR